MTRGLAALRRLEGLGEREARAALRAVRIELGRADGRLEACREAEAAARARAVAVPAGAGSSGRAVALIQGAARSAWLRAAAGSARHQREEAEAGRLEALEEERHGLGAVREARRRGRVLEVALERRAAERARSRRRAEEAEADDGWRPGSGAPTEAL